MQTGVAGNPAPCTAGKPPNATASIPEVIRYLPDDCRTIATVNVDEVMHGSAASLEDDGQDFEARIGLSPSDVSRFSIALGGKPNDLVAVLTIRLKKAAIAAQITSNIRGELHGKGVKYEEASTGGAAVFEETRPTDSPGDKVERGLAICLPESTLVLGHA